MIGSQAAICHKIRNPFVLENIHVSDPGPPEEQDALKSSHQELVTIANNLYQDTEDLLEGLTAPDTGELRSAALESFNTNIELFKQKVEEIINSVSSG